MELAAIPTEVIQTVTAKQAFSYRIIPYRIIEGILEIGVPSDFDDGLLPEIAIILNRRVKAFRIESTVFDSLLSKYYHHSVSQSVTSFNVSAEEQDNFMLRLVAEAQSVLSSDIHIEAYEDRFRVRFRIDGVLQERYTIKKADYPALINKIKIKANLDISEKRLPQDGRFVIKSGSSKVDLRISIMPMMFGEKVVIRLLNSDNYASDLPGCGLSGTQLQIYLDAVERPNGIILISGPTGSGKTSTLYATLKHLNKSERNILTIEDPVEYTLEGINQVQLKESIGLTFPRALRSFLRQDPDIIMVGEIRDKETAEMAIRAALTGHLVLSTIHTNSAIGTVNRLIDMGIPPFLIADTLNLSVAQRLVRKLCPHCKKSVNKDDSIAQRFVSSFNLNEKTLESMFTAAGCDSCFYQGYKGRIGLFELIPITNDFKSAVRLGQVPTNVAFESLQNSAIREAINGKTSIQEIWPILNQK